MRAGVFGGTFNPVHSGHVEIARQAARAFELDQVLFVPAANPPHKAPQDYAPYEHRYRMAELACAGDEILIPSRIEEGSARSYSILTIEGLKAQRPADTFLFLIGADAFAEIETWFRWRDVIAAVDFIVVSRPGHLYRVPPGARVHRLDTLALSVSSSTIRRALAAGGVPPELPPAVLAYIREHALYRGATVQ